MVGHGGGSRCPAGGFKVLWRSVNTAFLVEEWTASQPCLARSRPAVVNWGDCTFVNTLWLHCRRFLH
jgi:hypothetical protein